MKITGFVLVAALMMAPVLASAQDDADVPQDDSAGVGVTDTDADVIDSDADIGAEDALADTNTGPLAFGVVYSNGQRMSGTPNWTSTYNGTYKRYQISISGQSYYYLNYATVVTPAGDIRFCRSSSVGGKLLVYCYDKNGNVQPARFGFLTFKAK